MTEAMLVMKCSGSGALQRVKVFLPPGYQAISYLWCGPTFAGVEWGSTSTTAWR